MPGRALAAAALTASLSLPLAWVAPGGAAADVDARAAIQALLDERARAMIERDEAAFMATLARSSPAFVARQRRLFEWTGGVPLASYELEARWDRYGDLVRPSDERRYPGAQDVAIPVTEERYAIAGFDQPPALEDLYYTFVQHGGQWKVAEDTDLDDISLRSARHLWDFGPVQRERSEHFMLLRHPCGKRRGRVATCGPLPAGTLGLAERALERVASYWTEPWRERVVVLVPRSSKELRRMLQATFDLADFVAFAYFTIDTRGDLAFTGPRIVLNARALQGRSAESVTVVLAHELIHVATRRASGPFVPVFLEEGIAQHVGYDAEPSSLALLRSEVAAGRFDARLPRDHEFLTGGAQAIYTSYQEAQSAVSFFVETYGMTKLTQLYRRLGRVAIAPGTARYHLDRALQATIGVGYEDFEQAWASSIAAS